VQCAIRCRENLFSDNGRFFNLGLSEKMLRPASAAAHVDVMEDLPGILRNWRH
jgi:hypothetical protein